MNLNLLSEHQLKVYEEFKALFHKLIDDKTTQYLDDIERQRLSRKEVVNEIKRMSFGNPIEKKKKGEKVVLKKGERVVLIGKKRFAAHDITLTEIEDKIAYECLNNWLKDTKQDKVLFGYDLQNQIKYFAYMNVLREYESHTDIADMIRKVQAEYPNKLTEQAKALHYKNPSVKTETWKKRIQRHNRDAARPKKKKGTF
jgi:hypothetical protein